MCEQTNCEHVFDGNRIRKQSSNIMQFVESYELIMCNYTPSICEYSSIFFSVANHSLNGAYVKRIFHIFYWDCFAIYKYTNTLQIHQMHVSLSFFKSLNWMRMKFQEPTGLPEVFLWKSSNFILIATSKSIIHSSIDILVYSSCNRNCQQFKLLQSPAISLTRPMIRRRSNFDLYQQ